MATEQKQEQKENHQSIASADKSVKSGQILFDNDNWKEAIANFEEALILIDIEFHDTRSKEQKKKIYIYANNSLARCYEKLRDWQNVIKYAHNVLCIDSVNRFALFNRGTALACMGMYGSSIIDLNKATNLFADNEHIKSILKSVHEQMNNEIDKPVICEDKHSNGIEYKLLASQIFICQVWSGQLKQIRIKWKNPILFSWMRCLLIFDRANMQHLIPYDVVDIFVRLSSKSVDELTRLDVLSFPELLFDIGMTQ